MRREAHLIENEWFKGGWGGSELVYAMLDREWQALARQQDPDASERHDT